MEGIFVPIGFFLAIFAILYVYWTTRTKERLALVEKGLGANIFRADPLRRRLDLVKWGIFLIALGLGVVAGFALSNVIQEVVAFFTAILVCGGIGLIVAYFVINKLGKKED
jgi:peptidoglycan/LPS O-acetylase OafA/YrhL